jgi:hypothetical protein
VLPAGSPMAKGRADIQKFWAGAMQHHGDIKLTTLDVKPLGPDAAREIGSATFRTKGANPQDVALKYAVVSQRGDGPMARTSGAWINDPAHSQSAHGCRAAVRRSSAWPPPARLGRRFGPLLQLIEDALQPPDARGQRKAIVGDDALECEPPALLFRERQGN